VDIQDPQSISLDEATVSALGQVGEAHARLQELQPFSDDLNDRLRRSLLPDRITSTLNMEGLGVTRRQTLAVMDAMRVHETQAREGNEIQNTLHANDFVTELVDRDAELSEGVPRELNKRLLYGVRHDAGTFRRGAVELPGAPVPPPPASDVPALMHQVMDAFPDADACHPILQACWLHAQFTMVHPFSDGNGRTGRLLQDFALLRRRYLPVGIPTEQRDEYYSALAAADSGDWNALTEIVATLALKTIEKALRIAQEPEERRVWISNIAAAAAKRTRDEKTSRYRIWRIQVEEVIRTFCEVAGEIDRQSVDIGVSVRRYEVASFETWEKIWRGVATEQTRLCSMEFSTSEHLFYKLVFYPKRHKPLPSDLFDVRPDAVGIYLTGALSSDDRLDFERGFDDEHIRLREILFVGSNLYSFFSQDASNSFDCRDDLDQNEVVRGVFDDVFRRKMGLNF
jgi:Fic family protein